MPRGGVADRKHRRLGEVETRRDRLQRSRRQHRFVGEQPTPCTAYHPVAHGKTTHVCAQFDDCSRRFATRAEWERWLDLVLPGRSQHIDEADPSDLDRNARLARFEAATGQWLQAVVFGRSEGFGDNGTWRSGRQGRISDVRLLPAQIARPLLQSMGAAIPRFQKRPYSSPDLQMKLTAGHHPRVAARQW